ncbi:2268_t:CDS:2, partial [Gigaspora margarita]
ERQVTTKNIIDTLAKRKQILKVYGTRAKAFVSKKRKALSQIHDKLIYKIFKTATTLFDKEVDQYTTINKRNNTNNIESNRNMYDILPQEEVLSTKESWDSNKVQDHHYLGPLIMTDEDPVQTNLQTDKDQEIRETKLEEVKDATVPVYAKSETYAQGSEKNENIILTSMESEALLQIAARLTQFLPSDITQNVWSEAEDISTRSSDIVIKTVEKEVEFTTVVNRKKMKNKKNTNKSKTMVDPTRPSLYKKIWAGVHGSSTV